MSLFLLLNIQPPNFLDAYSHVVGIEPFKACSFPDCSYYHENYRSHLQKLLWSITLPPQRAE